MTGKPEIPKVGDLVRTRDGQEGEVILIEETTGQPRAWISVDWRLQRRKARKLKVIS